MTGERVWTRITRTENIPPREGRPVRIGDLEIAIFNLNGRFVTVENACPHKGGPLCDGIVTGTAVVCPLHGRHFDLISGLPVRAAEPSCLAVFPTRVEDGIILVDLEGAYKAIEHAA
ncbi:MAG TPA: Rieske 2Fe-2S domain-containing protein [Bryobacteraceae bacterium]|jgi:NAD(P)H-dependent nitrite reductase small subunit|nr:Rieske 2Fe-2S domain-containing protein [Bryobacteraceae bacterium]